MKKLQKMTIDNKKRIVGLDIARLLAFIGMVIVNFKIVMTMSSDSTKIENFFANILATSLEGRAAAVFVILAGIGLGLTATRLEYRQIINRTVKSSAWLLFIGLLNSLVFAADILHYYAFYFLLALFCLPLSTERLLLIIAAINIVFVIMILTLDYEIGWNWFDYSYSDFWTVNGFIRNLVFNGWHPIFPWGSFLLFGIILSRLQLKRISRQNQMIIFGIGCYTISKAISILLINYLAIINGDVIIIFDTKPIPPMPLYVFASMGIATTVIGICLRLSDWLQRLYIIKLCIPAGRQTLTLYIAHIFIGMGSLESLGMLGNQSSLTALISAILFCIVMVIYSYVWSQFFKHGLMEMIMRKITG